MGESRRVMGTPDPCLVSRHRFRAACKKKLILRFFSQAFGILSLHSTIPSPKAIPAHLIIALGAPNEATAIPAYFLRREKMEKSWQGGGRM